VVTLPESAPIAVGDERIPRPQLAPPATGEAAVQVVPAPANLKLAVAATAEKARSALPLIVTVTNCYETQDRRVCQGNRMKVI